MKPISILLLLLLSSTNALKFPITRRLALSTLPFLIPLRSSAAQPWSDSDLGKFSPLSRARVLEPARILGQRYDDVTKYQGELIDPLSDTTGSPVALKALVSALDDLSQIAASASNDCAEAVAKRLESYTVIGLKRTFNAYADNIFLSAPERSNKYLLGGATPTNTQSLLYLLRNDVIGSVEDLKAECVYAGKNGDADVRGVAVKLMEGIGAYEREIGDDKIEAARR